MRSAINYLMDRNNPVWREYLKAIIRIQIDAGVAGVQLDEADLPIFATGYGGCFCKDCMKLFRAWLQALELEDLPADLADTDYVGAVLAEGKKLQAQAIEQEVSILKVVEAKL